MFTKNYKNILRCMHTFTGTSSYYGTLPVKTTSGATRYISQNYQPYTLSFATTLNSRGIKVGTGTTTPTEDDYALESMVTSGISGNVFSTRKYVDEDGNACIEYNVSLSNTSSDIIRVTEVGAFVSLDRTAAEQGSSSTSTSSDYIYAMIDRTLLDYVLELEPNESATLTYTLKVGEQSE